MSTNKKPWLIGLVVVVVGLIALLALAGERGWFKGPLERRITAQSGRSFALDDLRVRLGFPLRVRMRGVRFDNPEWAAEPQMLLIEQADFTLAVGHLLIGKLVFPEARLTRPQVALERGADGRTNWTFEQRQDDGGELPAIGRLAVDQGRLTFHDPRQKTALQFEAQTLPADAKAGLQLRATGTFKNLKVDADAMGDSVLSLADTETPYNLNARFRIGATHGTAAGSVTGLIALAAVDLLMDVRGDSMAESFPLLAISLPPTPPYHLKGRLVRDGEVWRFHDFTGKVGDSDLSGDADISYRNKRPRLDAVLVSKLLDLNDLGGFIGAPPGTGSGETASPKQEREAQAAAAKPTLLPDKELKLARLRDMDADIRFKGKSFRGRYTPLDDVEMHAELQDGVLKTKPLNFGLAGGNVVSTLSIDARQELLIVGGDFQFKRINLGQLFPKSAMAKRSTGLVGGRAVLKGEGNSFADLMASADGTVGLAMGGGRVSNLLLEIVGLDAAEVLRYLFGRDRTVRLRCAVADFSVQDGIMQTRSVVIDTTDTNINMDGTINLRDESLDLTLHPLPKDYSPLSLRSPLHVKGTFKNPSVRPDKKLLIRGGLAAVLNALAGPIAALLPLLEVSPGDDVNCTELIAAAERHAKMKAPEAPAK